MFSIGIEDSADHPDSVVSDVRKCLTFFLKNSEVESWKETCRDLRENSQYLKQEKSSYLSSIFVRWDKLKVGEETRRTNLITLILSKCCSILVVLPAGLPL